MGDRIIEHQLRKLAAGGEDVNSLVAGKTQIEIKGLDLIRASEVDKKARIFSEEALQKAAEKFSKVRKNSKEEIEQAEREETTQERNKEPER